MRLVAWVLLVANALAAKALANAPPALADAPPAVQVFDTHEGNFTSIINPCMVVLTGRLLIFTEARLGKGGDSDPSRIGMKHSDDGGRTWSPMRVLLPSGIEPASTVGNLAAVVVPHRAGATSQRICLVFCVNNTLVFTTVSDDAGAHWSPPTDLTRSVKEAGEGWVATGPANAIVLRSGRILVPMNSNIASGSISIDYTLVPGSEGRNRQCPMASLQVGVRGASPSPLPPLHRGLGNVDPSAQPGVPLPALDPCSKLTLASLFKLQQRAYVLISDDSGKSWSRSTALPLLASETAVAELGDGRILARSRIAEAGWQDGCQHFALSQDGGSSWERVNTSQCVQDPGVQTSLLASPAADGAVLMTSPLIEKRCGDHLRGNLTLYRSDDGGTSWKAAAQVHADCSGYSSMAPLDARHIGVVWSTQGLPRGGPVMFRTIAAVGG